MAAHDIIFVGGFCLLFSIMYDIINSVSVYCGRSDGFVDQPPCSPMPAMAVCASAG